MKIDKHIPPPGKRKFPVEHPWSFVEPSQSFFLPFPRGAASDADLRHRFKLSCYKKAERRWGSGNYRTRAEKQGSKQGIRIWRLK